MTRKLRRNYSLSIVVRVVAILSAFISFSGPAQVTGASQRSVQQAIVPAQLAPAAQKPLVKFAKEVVYTTGGDWAVSVAVGDLNGDGKPDLVVNNAESNSVGVLLGNGDGTFQPAVTYGSGGTGVSVGIGGVAIGDLNGDGKPDLAVTNVSSNSVGVLLGNGDGTFQPAVTYSSGGAGAASIAIGDLNGDGKLDLVVAGGNGGNLSVLLGNGDGTFQPAITYGCGSGTYSVAIADLNGDGKPDLVVTNFYDGVVSVLLGNGDGTFQSPVSYSSGETGGPISVAIGDLNGDGHPDLVVANDLSSSVGVLLGNGDGTFQTPVTYPSGGYAGESVAIADVNGDGWPDIVVANMCISQKRDCMNSNQGSVAVLAGNGDGTFQAPVRYGSGGHVAWSVAVGDVNGDGRPDLLVANVCASGACTKAEVGSVGVRLNSLTVGTAAKVTSSMNPSQVNQSVTFTATITSNPSIPDGEVVAFYNGATKIGTGTTANRAATLTTSFSEPGKFVIEADYPGDAFHQASHGSLKQGVKQ
jgi:hypothetical protein